MWSDRLQTWKSARHIKASDCGGRPIFTLFLFLILSMFSLAPDADKNHGFVHFGVLTPPHTCLTETIIDHPTKNHKNQKKKSQKITNNHKKSQNPKKKSQIITKNHKQSQKITKNHKNQKKNHKKSQKITNNHKKSQKPKKKSQIITKNHKILFHNVVTFCDFFRKNTTRHFPARPGHPSRVPFYKISLTILGGEKNTHAMQW